MQTLNSNEMECRQLFAHTPRWLSQTTFNSSGLTGWSKSGRANSFVTSSLSFSVHDVLDDFGAFGIVFLVSMHSRTSLLNMSENP